MTSKRITPPLKWPGGKHYLTERIIALMPPHTHYVEPYFGGGAVLLAKDPVGVSEVVNDLHGELTNFWRVLQNEETFREFQRVVEAVPFSQPEWERACESLGIAPVEQAVAFFVRCRQSRAGQMRDFANLSRTRTRRAMNEQASAWMTAVEGLPEVAARLKRVVVLNDDALLERHKYVAKWFYDQEIHDYVGAHLHMIGSLTARTYNLLFQKKRAGHDWRQYFMDRFCHDSVLQTVQTLENDDSYTSVEERVREFVGRGLGCRRTYFNYKDELSASAEAPSNGRQAAAASLRAAATSA